MHPDELLRDALVFLVAVVVCVPLATRLRLGAVLGYLVAGCILGPFGLAFVSDVESTFHLAELGVVMMLFVIGLELDPARVWGMRRAVFGAGGLQMATCAGVLAAGALAAGLPWRAALVAGAALALSSTAIAVQTMKERGMMGDSDGKAAFGVLLFQDIAAIPLVGLVPLLAAERGGAGEPIGVTTLKIVGAVAAVIVIGRYGVSLVLRFIAALGSREVFTAFTLLVVLGVAQVMSLVGVSMALGAFLAGVLLASSEYRHALETDIEPFRGLLMGLFFMAVGMSIDFSLLAAQPMFFAALVTGLVVLKAGVLVLIAPTLGVAPARRLRFAALIAQGGEFAFVVFGAARTATVLPEAWSRVLTLVVALSMAATPLLLAVAEAWPRRRGQGGAREPATDAEVESGAAVLILGCGRYGQIISRLLFASRIRATVLDTDTEIIEVLGKFGFRVFYGDATRLDLLEIAGAGSAKVIVIAVDDVATSVRIAQLLRHHFPRAHVVARARDIPHWFSLRAEGISALQRETFESSLRSGRQVLEALGVRPHEARERADAFRDHNLTLLEGLRGVTDFAQRAVLVRQAQRELERQFELDRAALDPDHADEWHAAHAPDARGDAPRGVA